MKSEANPEQQVIITWQVHTDDQSVLPGMLAKSFVGQSFASPLCPPAFRNMKRLPISKRTKKETNHEIQQAS